MAQLGATMVGEVAGVEIELNKHINQQTDSARSAIIKGIEYESSINSPCKDDNDTFKTFI